MNSIKLLATAALCLLSMGAKAQTSMRITMQDGKQIDYPVSTIANLTWITNEENPDKPDVSPSGVQAVDLGLPSGLKWANMNIGATSLEDYGDYFAWGETEGYMSGKKNFSEKNYKWYMSTTSKDSDGFEVTRSGYTKYVYKSDASQYGYNGFYDDKTDLDPEDDAAHVNWGGDWRIPTSRELGELTEKCTWSWTEINGKNGYKVTGPNGNYIFLPAAGYHIFSFGEDYFRSGGGYYWTSSLTTNNGGIYISFGSSGVGWSGQGSNRYNGRSVRPVCQ